MMTSSPQYKVFLHTICRFYRQSWINEIFVLTTGNSRAKSSKYSNHNSEYAIQNTHINASVVITNTQMLSQILNALAPSQLLEQMPMLWWVGFLANLNNFPLDLPLLYQVYIMSSLSNVAQIWRWSLSLWLLTKGWFFLVKICDFTNISAHLGIGWRSN